MLRTLVYNTQTKRTNDNRTSTDTKRQLKTEDQSILKCGDFIPLKKTGRFRKAIRVGIKHQIQIKWQK